MEIETSERNGISVISIKGTVDMYNVTEFREILNELLKKEKYQIILDITKTPHIDSSGLAAIISLNNSLNAKGNRLRVCLEKQKAILFHHFALDKKLSLHYTMEAAFLSF